MKRIAAALIIVSGVVAGRSQADAAPPTVVPSPGYDARLQQSRAGASEPTVYQPGAPPMRPVSSRHHLKRTHTY